MTCVICKQGKTQNGTGRLRSNEKGRFSLLRLFLPESVISVERNMSMKELQKNFFTAQKKQKEPEFR